MSRRIGIDPPKGLAVWDTKARRFLFVRTASFWEIVSYIGFIATWEPSAKVYIEAPQKNAPVWTEGKGAKAGAAFAAMCQNVGENKCASKLLIEYCERQGLECIPVKPSKKTMSKLSDKEFRLLTNYDKQTSEHGRDAGMLVYGM